MTAFGLSAALFDLPRPLANALVVPLGGRLRVLWPFSSVVPLTKPAGLSLPLVVLAADATPLDPAWQDLDVDDLEHDAIAEPE